MRLPIAILLLLPLTATAGPKKRALSLDDYEQRAADQVREETMKHRLEAIRLLEELLEDAGVDVTEELEA